MEELHGRVGVANGGQDGFSEGAGYEVVGVGTHDGAYAQDGYGGSRVALGELGEAGFGGGLVLAVPEAFYRAYGVGFGEEGRVVGARSIDGGTAEVEDVANSGLLAGSQDVIRSGDVHFSGVGLAARRV